MWITGSIATIRCTINWGHYPMSDVQSAPPYFQVIFHNDDETPMEFVIELLQSVFNKSTAAAIRFAERIDACGQAASGIYPGDLANELLEIAEQRIRAAGHRLLITSEAVADDVEMYSGPCKICDALSIENQLKVKGLVAFFCDDCIHDITRNLPELIRN